MMHGGMMFFPWGMPFGGFWLLLIPVVILIGVGILNRAAAHRNRKDRGGRQVHRMSLQDKIIKLAMLKGGLLTVTDVAAETGLSFKKAEKTLNEMVDFSHVNMRISASGVVVYDFVEIRDKDLGNAKTLREMGV